MKVRVWWEIEVGERHSVEKVARALTKMVKKASTYLERIVGPTTIGVAVQPLSDDARTLAEGMDLPRLLPPTEEQKPK